MAIELESRVCYFTFGRFQPPTIGHKENFLAVKKAAKGHDYRIYISQTVDKKGTNPLDPDTKLKYMIKMFPEHRGKIFSGPRDPTAVFQHIMQDGYHEAYFLVGSDRVKAMQWVKNYNHKDYSFRKMDIISSGERDADGDTFAISGTKMRRAAKVGDFTTFRKGIPSALPDKQCRELMIEIHDNM
tara:strand:+ start:1172 stop:1726 length:555 start_codon:yes stop_codon:yes gene_type:complete